MDEDGKQTKIAHSMVAKDGEVRTTERTLFFPFWSKKMKYHPPTHHPPSSYAVGDLCLFSMHCLWADKDRSQHGCKRWRGENNLDYSFLPPLVKEDGKDIDDLFESISFMKPKICNSLEFPSKVVKFINACHCTGQVEAWLNLLMFSMRETIR